MISSLKSLVGKFDDAMRSAMEGAAGLCVTRTHYEVEIEHFLTKTVEMEDADIALILEHYGVKRQRLLAELRASLDRLKTGNTRGPAFSPSLVKMFSEAWSIATLNFEATQIRTGHALMALLNEDGLSRLLHDISKELQKVSLEALRRDFDVIVAASSETSIAALSKEAADVEAGERGKVETPTPFLDQYTTDITKEARAGRMDAVIGRDREIRQIVDVLMRRRQNNPILTGEAGVGKTAVVEGLALCIAAGDVPPALRDVRLHSLDLALLQAGASVKGEFENRLKGLVQEVKASPQPVILFIDEAHTMIGAGGQAGQNDAANILKPALARGELRTIAATTWSEYKQYFEKDAALARRFQVVRIEEPSEALCEAMLRGILASLERHHGVRILDESLASAVRFSHRYLAGRQLPDKAVSVLDTACARVALSQNASPSAMEEIHRLVMTLEAQKRVLTREQAAGASHEKRLAEIEAGLSEAQLKLNALKSRWEQENQLVQQIQALRTQLEGEIEGTTNTRLAVVQQLRQMQNTLRDLQQRTPLTHLAVDSQIVGEVISEWTGIPLGKMLDDEIAMILNLEDGLKKRVIGQDHALVAIAQRVQTSRANLDDPGKPIGVFLLAGPSGVGKTETALALAELLYGGEHNLISINMSEFQEAHSVSTLKGAPPGYVGYGQGGVLTEAIRRQPYSVVLLDEVEKAHADVLELFFQVFDKGYMEDGEGRGIDFRNTLILLTTNAASDMIAKLTADPDTAPLPTDMVAAIRPELNRIFKPAFLGRTLVVPYYPVRDEVLKQIIRLKLSKIQKRLLENHRVVLSCHESLVDLVKQRCIEVESGARNVDHLLSNTMLPEISRQLLMRMVEGEALERITVGAAENGEFIYSWNSIEHEEVLAQA
ncbi:MAG TPA: type VI secretion system ATPase TssH [Pseudacidobacterium sp.]|nr:type VI secretion system ATPase TssH [Pseudacidobacterium sp.]